jgi:hypothetical protein
MPGAGAGQIALLMTWLIIVQASTLLSLIDLAAIAYLPCW